MRCPICGSTALYMGMQLTDAGRIRVLLGCEAMLRGERHEHNKLLNPTYNDWFQELIQHHDVISTRLQAAQGPVRFNAEASVRALIAYVIDMFLDRTEQGPDESGTEGLEGAEGPAGPVAIEDAPGGAIIYTDGSVSPNPGPGGWGFVVVRDGESVHASYDSSTAEITVNEAEYRGIISAIEWALDEGLEHVEVRSDSELCVKQINGEYQARDHLLSMRDLAHSLIDMIEHEQGAISITWIPREENLAHDLAEKGQKEAQKRLGEPKKRRRRKRS